MIDAALDFLIVKGNQISKGIVMFIIETVNLLYTGICGLLEAVGDFQSRFKNTVFLLCGKLVYTVERALGASCDKVCSNSPAVDWYAV